AMHVCVKDTLHKDLTLITLWPKCEYLFFQALIALRPCIAYVCVCVCVSVCISMGGGERGTWHKLWRWKTQSQNTHTHTHTHTHKQTNSETHGSLIKVLLIGACFYQRSEERRAGKECRSRCAPY